MPLAVYFGRGTSSSSDGQNFPLDRRAQATGAVNPHKGAEPAVSFYSHVSDRSAPFHSTVISASASEAAQVLDGLPHHGADLHIEIGRASCRVRVFQYLYTSVVAVSLTINYLTM